MKHVEREGEGTKLAKPGLLADFFMALLLAALMLALPLVIYASRFVYTQFITNYVLWFKFEFYICEAAVAVALLAATSYCVARVIKLLKGNLVKGLFLIGLSMVANGAAILVPVPLTAEQQYFRQHINDFRQAVAAAKQGNLIADVIPGLTMRVESLSKEPLLVTFSHADIEYEMAYVYADDFHALKYVVACAATGGSGGDGQIYTVLDDHWYLCYRVRT